MNKFIAATLAVVCSAQPKLYNSGEIKTNEDFVYGRFTTRMQVQNEKGTVSSFFTYFVGSSVDPWAIEKWNELDIEIVPSVEATTWFTNLIYHNGYGKVYDGEYYQGFLPDTEWHTYSMEWRPNKIEWFVDGVSARVEEGTESVLAQFRPQRLMMNLWTPEFDPWQGGRDDSTMPWYSRYDWVEACQYNSTTDSFDNCWTDNFDTLDTNRWYASENWTFESNSSTFFQENVYVENGNLVLRIYKDGTDPNGPPANNETAIDAYVFGDPCSNPGGEAGCAGCLSSCHESYLFGAKRGFRDSSAACRCLPKQRAPQGYTYTGRNVRDKNTDLCFGCQECKQSYPIESDKSSAEKMNRCEPQTAFDFEFGAACPNLYDDECGADCHSCQISWPTGSNDQSPEAKCRCPVDQIKETIWGSECASLSEGLCGSNCTECRKSWLPSLNETGQSDSILCRCRNWA